MNKIIELFEKYRAKKCSTLIGKITQRIVFNNLYRLGLFILLTIIGGVSIELGGSSIIYMILFLSGISYMILFMLIILIYAFIINPLRRK